MFNVPICEYSYLSDYDHEMVWSVIHLSRGICFDAVLRHRPGDERLLMALVGEEDTRAFKAHLALGGEWRRKALGFSPTPEQQATRVRRVDALQQAIAANALLSAQPETVSAPLLGVTEARLLRIARRGDRWFAREVERGQDAVMRATLHAAA